MDDAEEREINGVQKNDRFYRQIRVPSHGYFNVDLMDMSNLADKKGNKNYKWCLCIIDIYSRYAWAFPIKTKSVENVIEVFRPWLKMITQEMADYNTGKPIQVQSDQGTEFGPTFKQFLDRRDIRQVLVDAGDHRTQGIIERFNLTLRMLFSKFFVKNDNFEWLPHLAECISIYNNRFHRTIQQKPLDVWRGKREPNQKPSRFVDDLKPGDAVRIFFERKVFDKSSSTPMFTKRVYEVEGKHGGKYKIVGKERRYSRWELKKSQFPITGGPTIEPELHEKHRDDKHKRTIKRGLAREGIDEANIIADRQSRNRRENPRYKQ